MSKLLQKEYLFESIPLTLTLNIVFYALLNFSLTYSSNCHQVTLLKHSLEQFINTMLKNVSRRPILVPFFHMALHNQYLPWSGLSSLYSPLTCVSATPHTHRPKIYLAFWLFLCFSLVHDSTFLPSFLIKNNKVRGVFMLKVVSGHENIPQAAA